MANMFSNAAENHLAHVCSVGVSVPLVFSTAIRKTNHRTACVTTVQNSLWACLGVSSAAVTVQIKTTLGFSLHKPLYWQSTGNTYIMSWHVLHATVFGDPDQLPLTEQ